MSSADKAFVIIFCAIMLAMAAMVVSASIWGPR